jgi:hypothetical protein
VHPNDPQTPTSVEDILPLTPGDCVRKAARTLPDAATAGDEEQVVTIDVAGRFRATITFRRFHHKRGKMSRWFWTAERAVKA